MPILCCSLAWGWWMQARLQKRLGWTAASDFPFLAGALACVEGLPAVWNAVATLAHATGTAVQVVYCAAALPALLYNIWLRRRVRERLDIKEAFVCEDVVAPTLCYPCSIAQMDREVTLRG